MKRDSIYLSVILAGLAIGGVLGRSCERQQQEPRGTPKNYTPTITPGKYKGPDMPPRLERKPLPPM